MKKMKIIKDYNEILKYLEDDKIIYENDMNSEKISKLKRLKEAGDFKSILKIFNNDINDIKNRLKDLDYNDINYNIKDNIITITYGNHIMTLLSTLKGKVKEYSTDEIDNKIFGNGWKDLFLEIEIDKTLLNKIDIINDLPNFMKGLGVGKKVYKKLIKDFNFISSFNGYNPSIDSSMVWESISKDNEIFTFTNDENIISFWNELDYDIIFNNLKNFYKYEGNIQLDDDFLNKYKLNEKDFIKKIRG